MPDQQTESKNPKTPQELNAELRELFDLLPDFIISHDVGTFSQDPDSPFPVDSRTPEEYGQACENLNSQWDRRTKSEIREYLIKTLSDKLEPSFLTNGAQRYLKKLFNKLTIVGIIRRNIFIHCPSELDVFTRILQWDTPSGGIFDSEVAPVIDRELYRMFMKDQATRTEIPENDTIAEAILEEEGDSYYSLKQMIQRQKEENELERDWRAEYMRNLVASHNT